MDRERLYVVAAMSSSQDNRHDGACMVQLNGCHDCHSVFSSCSVPVYCLDAECCKNSISISKEKIEFLHVH